MPTRYLGWAGWGLAWEPSLRWIAFLLRAGQFVCSASILMQFKLTYGYHSHMRALTSTYPKCDEASTEFFLDNLDEASNGCATSTSYDWSGSDDPTDKQRAEICGCKISAFQVPKCHWIKLGQWDIDTAVHFNFVYDCKKINGNEAPKVTEVDLPAPTTAPPKTAPPTTPTPTTEAPEAASPTAPALTAAPGSPDCTVQQLTAFTDALDKASSGCMSGTSYNWGGSKNPSDSQYAEICKCNAVISFPITVCSIEKGAYKVTLEEHYDWVMNTQCGTFSPPVKSNPSSSDTNAAVPASKSSNNIGMIVGIAGGVVAVAVIIGLIVCKRNRNSREEQQYRPHNDVNAMRSPVSYEPIGVTPPVPKASNYTDTRHSGLSDATHTTVSTANGSVRASGTSSKGSRGSGSRRSRGADNNIRYTDGGKWNDPVIMAARIQFDAVFFGPLLSRGGYGEVFRGTYRGETVAIKQLLPARRKDLKQIDDFLGEVKLMSSLEHERIVKFIGVAWNSLSDACMVVEYMDNGDLRSVLNRWDHGEEQRSRGFDADKIKIAMHVAHALTYLHSMQPVVVHRDLKSKNILLDVNFDAKLTDFGISRERADATMTAGVGSSLWMAPEVMMGERYNEKADVFSFGVVLSELDTHQLPYFHATDTESGKQIPETAILQQVMLGRLSVQFTNRADPQIVQLGFECISLDPKKRPTAAQVLHRVHQVMQGWRKATASK